MLATLLAKTGASAFVRDVRDIACKSTRSNLPPLQFRSECLHMQERVAASWTELRDKRRCKVLGVQRRVYYQPRRNRVYPYVCKHFRNHIHTNQSPQIVYTCVGLHL